MRTCTVCGLTWPDEANYCGRCGAPLSATRAEVFKTDPRGHLVLGYCGEDALLFSQRASQPFIVARNYDRRSGTWEHGEYRSEIGSAVEAIDPLLTRQGSDPRRYLEALAEIIMEESGCADDERPRYEGCIIWELEYSEETRENVAQTYLDQSEDEYRDMVFEGLLSRYEAARRCEEGNVLTYAAEYR